MASRKSINLGVLCLLPDETIDGNLIPFLQTRTTNSEFIKLLPEDLRSYNPPSHLDAVILLHPYTEGRLSLTDVTDARYTTLLPTLKARFGSHRICVIAYLVGNVTESTQQAHIDTVKAFQPTVLKTSDYIIICGNLKDMFPRDLKEIKQFMKKSWETTTQTPWEDECLTEPELREDTRRQLQKHQQIFPSQISTTENTTHQTQHDGHDLSETTNDDGTQVADENAENTLESLLKKGKTDSDQCSYPQSKGGNQQDEGTPSMEHSKEVKKTMVGELKGLEAEKEVLEDMIKGLEDTQKVLKYTIKKREHKIKGLEDTQKGLEDTIKRREDTIKGLEDTQKGLEDTIKRRENTIKGLDDTVKGLEGTIKRWEDAIKGLEDTIKRREDTIKGLEDTTKGREDTIKRREDTMKGLEDTIKGLKDTIKRREDTIKRQEDTIKGREDTITRREDAINGLEDTIKRRDDKIKGLEDTKQGRKDTITRLEDTIKRREDTIKGRDDTIKGRNDTIKRREDTIKGMGDTIKGLEDIEKGNINMQRE